jgi:hypothetical protein
VFRKDFLWNVSSNFMWMEKSLKFSQKSIKPFLRFWERIWVWQEQNEVVIWAPVEHALSWLRGSLFSCLTLAVDVQGKKIVTIEGLSQDGEPHPLQKAFVEKGAIQCGFCTPGMILTAKAFLDENPHPSEGEVKKAISGNLCRCTGYIKIVEAILSVAPSPSPLPRGERVWERGKGDSHE